MITIGKNNGTEYQPQNETGGANLLPNKAEFRGAPFVLVHYPWSWEWHPEHGFIPQIARLVIKPGCNGTTGEKGRRPNGRLAIAGTMEKDGLIFKVGDSRLGRWANYLYSLPVNRGTSTPGKHFIWMGEKFEKLGNGKAQQLDEGNSWWEFVLWMRDESGALQGMPQSTYNQIRTRYQRRLESKMQRNLPAYLVDPARATLDAMAKQWAEMSGQADSSMDAAGESDAMDLGPVPTKRKPGRPRKKKAE